MGLRLIRESSDTPNVTNADDARMVRYAYGGYNGFVQGKGRELFCEGNGDTLTINSGVIVLQGWEVEIDSNGWSMQVSRIDVTKRYFTIYCEVNLSMGGTVSIKSTMDTVNYPTIPSGDDLTKTSNGIARLELCHFTAQSGVISNVEKIINVVPYFSDKITQIEDKISLNVSNLEKNIESNKTTTNKSINDLSKRLDAMGFKEGVAGYTGTNQAANPVNSLKKCGKFVIFNFAISININTMPLVVTIPKEFCPKQDVKIVCRGRFNNPGSEDAFLTIPSSGQFTAPNKQICCIDNAGWETE